MPAVTDFFEAARQELPPIFALSHVGRFVPGLKPKTLRVLILAGKGPVSVKSGRRILLNRDCLLQWLADRGKAA